MTVYARNNPSTGAPEARDFEQAPPASKGWLPLAVDAKPSASSAQVVVDAGVVIAAGAARQTWALRAKTQGELDAEANASDAPNVKGTAVVAALTARINLDRSAFTAAQKLAALEADSVTLLKIARYFVRTP